MVTEAEKEKGRKLYKRFMDEYRREAIAFSMKSRRVLVMLDRIDELYQSMSATEEKMKAAKLGAETVKNIMEKRMRKGAESTA